MYICFTLIRFVHNEGGEYIKWMLIWCCGIFPSHPAAWRMLPSLPLFRAFILTTLCSQSNRGFSIQFDENVCIPVWLCYFIIIQEKHTYTKRLSGKCEFIAFNLFLYNTLSHAMFTFKFKHKIQHAFHSFHHPHSSVNVLKCFIIFW